MTPLRRTGAARAAIAVALLTAPACARERHAAQATIAAGTDVKIADTAIPTQLAGLRLEAEDITDAVRRAGDDSYLSDVRLWSIRDGTRLRATLQAARFAADAPATADAFQQHVAGQVGGTNARIRHIADQRVYVAAGNRQVHYTWFRGIYMIILSVSADTTNGRALLRAALAEVQP